MQTLTLLPELTSADGFTISTDPGNRVYIGFPNTGPIRATGRRLTAADSLNPCAFDREIDAARRLMPTIPSAKELPSASVVIRNAGVEIDHRHGLTRVVITTELAAALAEGKALEVDVEGEFTVVIRQAQATSGA